MDSTSMADWLAFSNSTGSPGPLACPCWHGSEIELGILEAMYLHQCAAPPSCTWPSDIFGRLVREHDLLKQPLPLQPPFATIPSDPSLGVELDRDALHHQTDVWEFCE